MPEEEAGPIRPLQKVGEEKQQVVVAEEESEAVAEDTTATAEAEPLQEPLVHRKSVVLVRGRSGDVEAGVARTPSFAPKEFEEAVKQDPDAPKTLLTFNPKRAKGSAEEIKSPRSVEAMRRLGVVEDDLLETSKEALYKQHKGDTKVLSLPCSIAPATDELNAWKIEETMQLG